MAEGGVLVLEVVTGPSRRRASFDPRVGASVRGKRPGSAALA